jgi:uncharacterized membrane protein
MSIAKPGAVFYSASALVALALAPWWLLAFPSWHRGLAGVAIFAFFSGICHQHAERSFVLFGTQAAVCARCLGIYAGAAVGGLLRMESRIAIRLFCMAFALNVGDVLAESAGLHGNLPLLRLLIGGAMGIAVGSLLASNRRSTTDHVNRRQQAHA